MIDRQQELNLQSQHRNSELEAQTITTNSSLTEINTQIQGFEIEKKYLEATRGEEENLKYAGFIRENAELFGKSLKERKILSIHILMSQFVGTRTSLQCRSHHQKMLKKYGTLPKIIKNCSGFDSCQGRECHNNINRSHEQKLVDLLQVDIGKEPSLWTQLIHESPSLSPLL